MRTDPWRNGVILVAAAVGLYFVADGLRALGVAGSLTIGLGVLAEVGIYGWLTR